MKQSELLKCIAVTSEVMGTQMTEDAARMMLDDLKAFNPESVATALQKVRREVKGKLTVSDIIKRIDDGRLGPEEAWAICPKSEGSSVVWTDECAIAYGVAAALIAEGQLIPARMAFLEKYRAEVAYNRAKGLEANWFASLGHDVSCREVAVSEALRLGRVSQKQALMWCPQIEDNLPAIEYNGEVIALDFSKGG